MRQYLLLFLAVIFFGSHAQQDQLMEAGYKRNLPEITKLGRALIQATRDSIKLPTALARVGNAFYAARQIDSALHYQNRAAILYEQQNQTATAAYAYVLISRFYFENLQLHEAALAAHKSYELYQQTSDYRNIASSLVMLSNLNRGLNHQTEALYYARKAVQLSASKNLDFDLAESRIALSKALLTSQYGDSALLYATKALKQFEQLQEPVGLGVAQAVVASSYFSLKEIEKAKELAIRAEKILLKVGYENELPDVLLLHARISQQQNQPDSARLFFLKASAVAHGNYLFHKEMEAQQALFQLAMTAENQQAALQHLLRYNQLRDSAYTLENARMVERTRAQYSLREKQREIELLEANARTKDAQLRLVKTFNWLLIIGLVLSTIIAFTVYRLIINRNKARLAVEREQLQKQRFTAVLNAEEGQREKISRELHDGVGQLISIVRLTLSGENSTPATEKGITLLDQAVGELRAISHNLMPQPLVKKGLIEALKSLTSNLEQTGLTVEFNHPDKEIEMDVQRKISIYRIVQEITNNILKHAEANKIQLHIGLQQNLLELLIEDNGKGFDTSQIGRSKGIGWDNIYARLDVLNGTMEVTSAPGKGAHFKFKLPIPHNSSVV